MCISQEHGTKQHWLMVSTTLTVTDMLLFTAIWWSISVMTCGPHDADISVSTLLPGCIQVNLSATNTCLLSSDSPGNNQKNSDTNTPACLSVLKFM